MVKFLACLLLICKVAWYRQENGNLHVYSDGGRGGRQPHGRYFHTNTNHLSPRLFCYFSFNSFSHIKASEIKFELAVK